MSLIYKPPFIMTVLISYETELLNPVFSFMNELSNSVKNRNTIDNSFSTNGNNKISTSNGNNVVILKKYVDHGIFTKKNKTVAERFENNNRYTNK